MRDPDYDNPVLEEIREIRRQVSARFDHDLSRYVACLMEMEDAYRDRLVSCVDEGGR